MNQIGIYYNLNIKESETNSQYGDFIKKIGLNLEVLRSSVAKCEEYFTILNKNLSEKVNL